MTKMSGVIHAVRAQRNECTTWLHYDALDRPTMESLNSETKLRKPIVGSASTRRVSPDRIFDASIQLTLSPRTKHPVGLI